MEDKYLAQLEEIVISCENILEMDYEIESTDETPSSLVKDLPIKDAGVIILNDFRYDKDEHSKQKIRKELSKILRDLPALASGLNFLGLKKLDFSYLPIDEIIVSVMVTATQEKNITKENLKQFNALAVLLEETENKVNGCINKIEYRMFRLLLISESIGCYLGGFYIADFLLRQIIVEEEGGL